MHELITYATLPIAVLLALAGFVAFNGSIYKHYQHTQTVEDLESLTGKARLKAFRRYYSYPRKFCCLQPLYIGPLYELPRGLVITDNGSREQILQTLLPQLEREGVNYQRLLKTLYRSILFDQRGLKLWLFLVEQNIYTVDEFRKFILTTDVDHVVLEGNIQKALQEVYSMPNVETRSDIHKTFERFQEIHYLSLADVRTCWTQILLLGPFKELRNMEELMNLYETTEYHDLFSFINSIDSHRWGNHLPKPVMPEGFPALALNLDSREHHIEGLSDRVINVMREIRDEKYTCPICYELLDIECEMWGCRKCTTVTHWECFQEWCNSHKLNFGLASCVSCRTMCYSAVNKPATCWCHKRLAQINDVNPNSCGQRCNFKNRALKKRCLLPCHPGPHVLVNQADAHQIKVCGKCLIQYKSKARVHSARKLYRIVFRIESSLL